MQTSTPAKVILFGEHAVVYGQPAIAVPVTSLRAYVSVAPAVPGSGILLDTVTANFSLVDLSAEPEVSLPYALWLALREWGIHTTPDLLFTLTSDIPLGRGLGSGAAVSASLIKTLALALGKSLEKDALNALVYEVEKKHHGTPSGIDNTVVVYEQPIYFVRGQAIESIKIGTTCTFLVGDSGYGTPTHIPVGDVRRLYEREPERASAMFAQIGEITQRARAAIESGKLATLGELMNQNHDLLQRLGVSSVELDLLCESALAAGALGAKMSGGGRGGNMLALVLEPNVAAVSRALQKAGAVRVIKTRLLPD